MSIRFYLFEENGNIRRITAKLTDDLIKGKAALPEYAGKKLRVAEVWLKLKDRKPCGFYRFIGDIWYFDKDGTRQKDHRKAVKDALELIGATLEPPNNKDSVIDITSKLTEKKHKDKYKWEVTQDDIKRVARLIWPPKKDKKKRSRKVIKLPVKQPGKGTIAPIL
jgi:hypothetical protein